MREEAPVDETENKAIENDKTIPQSKLIEKLQAKIANITNQNKSLRKENNDLRSVLRLEAAAYDARRMEVEHILEGEMEKIAEEKRILNDRIAF